MLGKAAVVIWCEVRPEARAEFEDWHSHEHMPERLAIPGFLRGSRWVGASGEASYFMLYELDEPGTLTGQAYLARLNDPTPWSRRMMPEHRNMARSLCVVRASFGGGLPHTLATIRFHASAQPRALLRPKSSTGVHLLESQPMAGAQTTEQRIRGNDRAAGWVGLLGGYDEDEIAAAAHALAGQGTVGVYRLSYSLAPGETQ